MGKDTVVLLGVRGSLPVSGGAFARYGGATTCFLLELDGQPLLVDGGSGLLRLSGPVLEEASLPLVLTHPHADHLIGLPLCPYLLQPGKRLELYAVSRGGLDACAQVSRLLSPPLWPVEPRELPAEIVWHELPETLRLGRLTVERLEGVHPGGVSLLRVRGGNRTVVVMTDCTLAEERLPTFTAFARDCDLLLCDGQYGEEEWPACAGYGHSTWLMAARFAAACGAKALRVVHHDPRHTDAALDEAEAAVRAVFPAGALAREGEAVSL